MTDEGPPLELLLRRLAETPPDFLADPATGSTGVVHTRAVVADLLRLHGATEMDPKLAELDRGSAAVDGNRQRLALILAWLLADGWFLAHRRDPAGVLAAIVSTAGELAGLVPAAAVVGDPDRREEVARLALAALWLRPAGESEVFARDRLTTLSTAERGRVLAASRAAEERARAIREALAKKAAAEAADKWTRE
jgi:hypothetical protein